MQPSRSRFVQWALAAWVLAMLAPGWVAAAPLQGETQEPLAALENRIAGLDIDDRTREACYVAIDAGRHQQRAAREQMRAAHLQLRTLLEQDTPSEEAVMAEADYVADLVAEARKTELRTLLRILSLLDDEALAELRARPAGFWNPPSQRATGPTQHRF